MQLHYLSAKWNGRNIYFKNTQTTKDVIIDVVDAEKGTTFFRTNMTKKDIQKQNNKELNFLINLPEDSEKTEIRIFVGADSKLKISNYTFKKI